MQNHSGDNNEFLCNISHCISISSLYVCFSSVFGAIRSLYVTAALCHASLYQILHIPCVFLVTLLLLFAYFFFLPLLSLPHINTCALLCFRSSPIAFNT